MAWTNDNYRLLYFWNPSIPYFVGWKWFTSDKDIETHMGLYYQIWGHSIWEENLPLKNDQCRKNITSFVIYVP